jgi:hypothetical protein
LLAPKSAFVASHQDMGRHGSREMLCFCLFRDPEECWLRFRVFYPHVTSHPKIRPLFEPKTLFKIAMRRPILRPRPFDEEPYSMANAIEA